MITLTFLLIIIVFSLYCILVDLITELNTDYSAWNGVGSNFLVLHIHEIFTLYLTIENLIFP